MRTVLVTLLLASAVPATAAAELKLTLSGTEFMGMPAFEARLGDEVVGSGTLTTISPQGEVFTFEVDGDYASKPLEIRFTNDRYEEGVGDRNLYILGVSFAGVNLPIADLVYRQGDTILDRDNGRLGANSIVAIANPPAGGWPLDAEPTEAVSAADAADMSSETEAPAEAEVTPEVAAPADAAAAPETEAADDSAAVTTPPPAAAPECVETRLDIVGFNNGAVALSSEQLAQLDGLDLPDGCSIRLTGYSSVSGSATVNEAIAQQRAEAVAAALNSAGQGDRNIEIVIVGETSEFGAEEAANRRVVVELLTSAE